MLPATPAGDTRPVWLLDCDGVVNAWNPGWDAPRAERRVPSATTGGTFTIRYAPALIDRIRALHESGLVEIRWCSTWCGDTVNLAAALGLPAFPDCWDDYRNGFEGSRAKLDAARAVAAEGRPLIWTDDDLTPVEGNALYDELSDAVPTLLIRPDDRHGLQPRHLDAIEAFIAEEAEVGRC